METIFKYEISLSDEQVIVTKVGAKPLFAAFRDSKFYLWCAVNDHAPSANLTVCVCGTGHRTPMEPETKYLCSVLDGPFVWHVYVQSEPVGHR